MGSDDAIKVDNLQMVTFNFCLEQSASFMIVLMKHIPNNKYADEMQSLDLLFSFECLTGNYQLNNQQPK